MMIDANGKSDLESRIKEVGEENALLLQQLHQVQEELERYFLRNLELEDGLPLVYPERPAPKHIPVYDELADALAENRRLKALVEVQRKIYYLEQQNSLNSKLGNLLIQVVDSPRSLIALPGKLGRIWRSYKRQTPPAALGGAGFGKVAMVYDDGGFDAVEKLMEGLSVSSVMRANAYTSLGRYLMGHDLVNAAEAARRAYALDPRPYRLKWLAFRLHEAGDVVEAEAMLDSLPADTHFSESEGRQLNRARHEARVARQKEVTQQAEFLAHRAGFEDQLRRLERDLDEQTKLARDRAREIDVLVGIRAQLEQSRSALQAQLDQRVAHAAERCQQLEALKQAEAQLGQKVTTLQGQLDKYVRQAIERDQEVETLKRAKDQSEQRTYTLQERLDRGTTQAAERKLEIEALTRNREQLEQKISMLDGRLIEAVGQVAERDLEISALKRTEEQLEQNASLLQGRVDEAMSLIAERNAEIAVLTRVNEKLEQKELLLEGRLDESVRQATQYHQEAEGLKQIRSQLEQEKSDLEKRHEKLATLLMERGNELDAWKKSQLEREKVIESEQQSEAAKRLAEHRLEIDALRQAAAQLDQEKITWQTRYNEVSRVAAERLKQVDELRQLHQSHQANEAAFVCRQHLMGEEMARAEAQLDMIMEMLHRGQRQ
ncbi:hypothetical protein [Burkholderia territorii]|uniref:hypothetical protein n=1 Tax=Burkholderia territorii TaxID=1503055 RepID=UPI000B2CA114|nr:hypothetical protein [Burkholderia territorii]